MKKQVESGPDPPGTAARAYRAEAIGALDANVDRMAAKAAVDGPPFVFLVLIRPRKPPRERVNLVQISHLGVEFYTYWTY